MPTLTVSLPDALYFRVKENPAGVSRTVQAALAAYFDSQDEAKDSSQKPYHQPAFDILSDEVAAWWHGMLLPRGGEPRHPEEVLALLRKMLESRASGEKDVIRRVARDLSDISQRLLEMSERLAEQLSEEAET